jgi:hypothetical protein
MSFIDSNDCILKWNGEIIACLTSNNLSENLSFINTSGRTQAGALTVIQVANSYTISFDAVFVSDLSMSWKDLSLAVRSMQLGDWEMTGVDLMGFGYLSGLDIIADSGGIITFTGQIIGYGVIVPSDTIYSVWYQDVDTYVDNGGKYVFLN